MKPDDLEREARRVLEPLRCAPVAISSSRQVEAGRAAALPRLAALIEGVPAERRTLERRRQRVRRLSWTASSALAIAAGAWLWVNARSPEPTAGNAGAAAPQLTVVQGRLSQKGTVLASGAKYAIDSLGRLSTPPESGARFITDQGVDVDVAANSTADLNFSGNQQRISLNRGSIRLSVPKLKPGASLSVATPDAIVTVHGTRFSVEVGEGKSCVRVSEGIVSVARGDALERLTAGQQSNCGPSDQSAASDTQVQVQAEADMPRARARSKNSGTLTQENQLFQSALAAEQSGNLGQAELLANRLLTRYAASPMAPEARAIVTRVRTKRAHTSSNP